MDLPKEILNVGLDMSMEFGKNLLKPINERLHKKYPNISSEDLEKYNTICKEVNKFANDYVYDNVLMIKREMKFVDFEKFKEDVLEKFDWISKRNLNHLYSQSCYFASK